MYFCALVSSSVMYYVYGCHAVVCRGQTEGQSRREESAVWANNECNVPNIAGTTRDAMMLALKYTLV